MKILIAPDKFKYALDARGAAEALAAGAQDALPDMEITYCPLGDGGEVTGRLLAEALGAEERSTTVLDPLGRRRHARWWLAPDQCTAIVEMAEASGVALLGPRERDALHATSFGTGQLLKAARDAGCTRALLCVGGSATVDGGAGCLQALGWELLDTAGVAITEPASGATLPRIGTIRPPAALPAMTVDILCDVDNPLLGPRGAAPVFGPQKGASPAAVRELERALTHWADVLRRACGQDVADIPGSGAAGGLPAGLLAALDAHLRPGFEEIAEHVRLRDRLAGCDLCLTGEGRIDNQTTAGKVVAGVARLAREQGVPTVAFAGAARPKPGQTLAALAAAVGVEQIVVITPTGMALPEALAATAANLRRAARDMLAARR